MSQKLVLPIFTVDAFAEKPFEGNGAAVVLLNSHQSLSKSVKQKIAAEMKLSETAFITEKSETCSFKNGNNFKLEWFTPVCEVVLCGHATVAAAAVLFMVLGNRSKEVEFETLSGILKAKYLKDTQIGIDIPMYISKPVNGEYDILVKTVVGSLPVQDVVISESNKVLIRLSDEVTRNQLETIKVTDHELLSAAPEIYGAIVTLNSSRKVDCKDDNGRQYDFISRYFAPWAGISEDPVTGAAHAVLAPYWSKIFRKTTLYARQCSPRGGNLNIEVLEDRVQLSGNAVIVIQGQITL